MLNVSDTRTWTEQLDIVSEEVLASMIYGAKGKKSLIINPDYERFWNYRTLSVFLNEFDFIFDRRTLRGTGQQQYESFTYADKENLSNTVQVHIYLQAKAIEVIASVSFLRQHGQAIRGRRVSDVGSQGRALLKPNMRDSVKFEIHKDIELDTSLAMLKNFPLFFYQKSSFSRAFRLFAKSITKAHFHLKESIDTHHIFEYLQCWKSLKTQERIHNSFEDLMRNITGYLHLNIHLRSDTDKLPMITIDEVRYTIISGVYICPFAQNLIKNDSAIIDGLLFDTTWKVMPYFVTSILMISSYNVGIPIAFSFGLSEDTKIYSLLIDKFKELFDINLKVFKAESDQGSALKAVCDSFKNHLACVRHFLVSLGTKQFSFQIGNMITCRSEAELNLFFKQYSEKFAEITDEKLLKILHHQLFKVGLKFENNVISIEDDDKWSRISLIKRIEHQMPSTTNSLEGTHGHLNADTPRRNLFWPSIYRIINSIVSQDFNFANSVAQGFNHQKRKVMMREKHVPAEQMDKEIEFFHSSKEECQCGETALESKLLRIDIPCSHRVHLGATFPAFKPPDIEFKIDKSEAAFTYTINKREEPNLETSIKSLKDAAVKQIRRYSHYKKKIDITTFVQRNWSESEEFVNGKPISYYLLIHNGILHFDNVTQEKKATEISSETSETGDF